MNLPRKQVSKHYFYGNFGFDAFMLFPHGVFMIYDESLGSLWMFKTLRVRDLIQYINNQNIKYVINTMVNYKQQQAL